MSRLPGSAPPLGAVWEYSFWLITVVDHKDTVWYSKEFIRTYLAKSPTIIVVEKPILLLSLSILWKRLPFCPPLLCFAYKSFIIGDLIWLFAIVKSQIVYMRSMCGWKMVGVMCSVSDGRLSPLSYWFSIPHFEVPVSVFYPLVFVFFSLIVITGKRNPKHRSFICGYPFFEKCRTVTSLEFIHCSSKMGIDTLNCSHFFRLCLIADAFWSRHLR